MCVCTDQSAMQLVTTVPAPAACAGLGRDTFEEKAGVPDLQELTNSLQSTKKTRQGREKSPAVHVTDTSSEGTHLKQTVTSKQVLAFFFFKPDRILTLHVHLFCLDPSGRRESNHMKDVWHCTMCIRLLLYDQLHISKPLLLREDILSTRSKKNRT